MLKSLFLLAVLVAAARAEGGAATVLTEDTFDAAVASGPHFVKFFAPWCGHCKRLAPTWDELAGELNAAGGTKIATVDCTVEKSLCSKHNIRGYPTLKLFSGGAVKDYSGGRTIDALRSFATADSAGSAQKASSEDVVAAVADKGLITATSANFEKSIAKGYAFVKFYAPWCGHCKRLAPTWDELALKFQTSNDVLVVRVDCTENSDVCQKYGVRGYPTLILFKDGEKVENYSGGRTLDAFTTFLTQHGAPTAEAAGTGDHVGDDDVKSDGGLMTLTDTTFAAGVRKGFSLVKFYAPWCGHCKRLAPTWDSLAQRYESNNNINIARVDCTVNKDTCSKFEVRGYPTILAFNNGEKLNKYSGKRDIDSFVAYIADYAPGHDEL